MTEGNGHVIDPNGDARRALQEAVAEHGPEVLSDAAIMDTVCRDQLAGLPGESILIGDAARTNVPALLNELIPRLGNYGAIQSAATTLASEHNLDMAASLWVVREFARALGYIAAGPATGTSASVPGSGPRPVPGSGAAGVPGLPGLARVAGRRRRVAKPEARVRVAGQPGARPLRERRPGSRRAKRPGRSRRRRGQRGRSRGGRSGGRRNGDGRSGGGRSRGGRAGGGRSGLRRKG